tara:strand:- start:1128 stop:1427 length:300 start_codon:yes stop_codon:yes gene_type:complete
MKYYEHQAKAVEILRDHILNCKHAPIDIETRFDEADLMETDLYEEGQQIRFIQDGILKIKWESPCAWVGCYWHLYYCKLAPHPEFKEIEEVLGLEAEEE